MSSQVGTNVRDTSGAELKAVTRPRVTDALLNGDRRSFQSFLTLPSNARAVEAAMLFAAGNLSQVAIKGQSGWGKTHLLESAAAMARRESDRPVRVFDAVEWLSTQAIQEFSGVLILDNVQDAVVRMRLRQRMRAIFDRRVRTGRPTLLAFTTVSSKSIGDLPLPGLRNWTVETILNPTVAERPALVVHMAKAEGMELADPLVHLICRRVPGNGRSIAAALNRLRVVHHSWVRPHHVLRAFGILTPLLSDRQGWDLRDFIHETISHLVAESPCLEGVALTTRELSVYAMLHLLQVTEDDVAKYFGMSSGEVYRTAHRVARVVADGSVGDFRTGATDAIIANAFSLR